MIKIESVDKYFQLCNECATKEELKAYWKKNALCMDFVRAYETARAKESDMLILEEALYNTAGDFLHACLVNGVKKFVYAAKSTAMIDDLADFLNANCKVVGAIIITERNRIGNIDKNGIVLSIA